MVTPILAAAILAAMFGASDAFARDVAGQAVDNFCADYNASAPYSGNCYLCHSTDWSEYIAPAWDWYYSGEMQNFCLGAPENFTPRLNAIGDRLLPAGEPISFTISATDPDADELWYYAQNLPTDAYLTDNGDGTALFEWMPSAQQVGHFPLRISVIDTGYPIAVASESIILSVGVDNHPPVLQAIGNRSTTIDNDIHFTVYASDADQHSVRISAANLPAGASFVDNGDGSASFNWTPNNTQAGSHHLLFSASDDGSPQGLDIESVALTVYGANNAPQLIDIGNRSAQIDTAFELLVAATDANGDPLVFGAEGLPDGASITDNDNNTATLRWTPHASQAGQHQLTVFTADNQSPPLADAESFVISVGDGNHPPVLAEIGERAMSFGQRLELPLSASDPDGDPLTFSASALPVGAELIDYANGSALLRWTPTSSQSGSHSLTIEVIDGGAQTTSSDSETFIITVLESDITDVTNGSTDERETDGEHAGGNETTAAAASSPLILISLLLMALIGYYQRPR